MGFSRWFGGWGWLYSAPLEVRDAQTRFVLQHLDAWNGFFGEFLQLLSAGFFVQAPEAKLKFRF
jgi:hypothetical protein